MQTPNPLLNELAPQETLELEDPVVDVEEEVVPDPVEAGGVVEVDDEEDVEELDVEVEVEVDEDVEVLVDVEPEEDVWEVDVAAGVSLQGLLGKAIYEGIDDGIAGTWHFPLMKMNPTSHTHSFPL